LSGEILIKFDLSIIEILGLNLKESDIQTIYPKLSLNKKENFI